MSGPRTENPTARRFEQAKQQGRLPKSPLLSCGIVVGVVGIGWDLTLGPLGESFAESFRLLSTITVDPSAQAATLLTRQIVAIVTPPLFVLLAVLVLSGLCAELLQTKGLWRRRHETPEPPLPAQPWYTHGYEAAIYACGALLSIAVLLVFLLHETAGIFSFRPLHSLVQNVEQAAKSILRILAGVFIFLGVIDWMLRWMQWRQQLKMTRQELVREQRIVYGHPEIRKKRRQQLYTR